MRTMLVIGAGRFGSQLAAKLTELGCEVLVVDKDEDAVMKVEPHVTRAQIGDCMDGDVLESLGVRNFDVCFVCISDNFQSSMEITSMLKEHGARDVVSKADREIQAELLKKIGADEVVYPERDMARRAAVRYSAKGAFDYIELSPEYAIYELTPPASWVGSSVRKMDVRSRHRINIIGIKENGRVMPMTSADHIFSADEHLIIAGERRDIVRMIDKG